MVLATETLPQERSSCTVNESWHAEPTKMLNLRVSNITGSASCALFGCGVMCLTYIVRYFCHSTSQIQDLDLA